MFELSRLLVVIAIWALVLWVKVVVAQRGPGFEIDFDAVEIRAQHVAGQVHMVTAEGGNIGVLAGADGLLLVDDQFAQLTAGLRRSIDEISPEPIRFIINTHFHNDHTSGNENFAAAGALIVAHENVRRVLSAPHFMETVNTEFAAFPDSALPVVTFEDSITFHLNGEEVEVFHAPTAHTDGDAIIYFHDSDVIHIGDIFRARGPVYDFNNGGSYEGVIRAMDSVLLRIGEETKIIPGHGRIASRRDLQRARDSMVTVRERVVEAIAEGKTLEQVIAAHPTDGFGWEMPRLLSIEKITEWIFLELSENPSNLANE